MIPFVSKVAPTSPQASSGSQGFPCPKLLLWLQWPLTLWFLASACTRSTVPMSLPPTSTPTVEVVPVTPTPSGGAILSGYPLAVVWVPEGKPLEIYQSAGITGPVIDTLAYNAVGLELTGSSTQLGSSLWVEIQRPAGGNGWINAWNLTEFVAPETFCADLLVETLLAEFQDAIAKEDGQRLAQLSNPRRGLVFRYAPRETDLALSLMEVSLLFTSAAEYDWGVDRESGQSARGSFRDVVLPALVDVLGATPGVTCNSLQTGQTEQPAEWPTDLTNLNFKGFFRPAPDAGNKYDWRAWALGIEFVEGRPYITILVHYRGEI